MERWVTKDEVHAARSRIESAIPNWVRPRAHGLIVDGVVAAWNVGEHYLPPAVLASVLGHDGSTAAVPVSPAQLELAIERLAPAEACVDYEHPNLLAWRQARGHDVVAVFVS